MKEEQVIHLKLREMLDILYRDLVAKGVVPANKYDHGRLVPATDLASYTLTFYTDSPEVDLTKPKDDGLRKIIMGDGDEPK